jgi:hypothetical protein
VTAAVKDGSIAAQASAISEGWTLGRAWLESVRLLTKAWPDPATFYYYARQRSVAMAQNATEILTRHRLTSTLAVSGGFHSAEIARYLWEHHGVKSLIVTPAVESLRDGSLYQARLLSEERGWSWQRAAFVLVPTFVLTQGPIATLSQFMNLGRANLTLWRARRAQAQRVDQSGRRAALSSALSEQSNGTSLFVEAADLRRSNSDYTSYPVIWADQFQYKATAEDMPGHRWIWSTSIEASKHGAVCCLRSRIPVTSASLERVVWLPRSPAFQK